MDDVLRRMKMNAVQQFLQGIAMNESSGGQFTDHEPAKHGVSKGASAYGTYGLMPNTIREMHKKMGVNAPPEVLPVIADDERLKEYLSQNPDKEQIYAEHLAGQLLDKTGIDPEGMTAASVGWRHGHNMSPARMGKRAEKSGYAQNFRKTLDQMYGLPEREPASAVEPVNPLVRSEKIP